MPKKSPTLIPVSDASDAQLIAYIRDTLNFPVEGTPSRAKLMATLDIAGFDEDREIEVDPKLGGPQEVKETRGPVTHDRRRDDDVTDGADPNELVTIMVAKEKGKFGQMPVQVMHNGVRIDVPRGKAVKVKAKFAWVLQDAVTVVYNPLEDELGGVDEGEEVPSYPVSYFGTAAA